MQLYKCLSNINHQSLVSIPLFMHHHLADQMLTAGNFLNLYVCRQTLLRQRKTNMTTAHPLPVSLPGP